MPAISNNSEATKHGERRNCSNPNLFPVSWRFGRRSRNWLFSRSIGIGLTTERRKVRCKMKRWASVRQILRLISQWKKTCLCSRYKKIEVVPNRNRTELATRFTVNEEKNWLVIQLKRKARHSRSEKKIWLLATGHASAKTWAVGKTKENRIRALEALEKRKTEPLATPESRVPKKTWAHGNNEAEQNRNSGTQVRRKLDRKRKN